MVGKRGHGRGRKEREREGDRRDVRGKEGNGEARGVGGGRGGKCQSKAHHQNLHITCTNCAERKAPTQGASEFRYEGFSSGAPES